MIVIGIDPGLTGAIALLDPATRWLELHDIPVLPQGKRKEVNAAVVADIVASAGATRAVVERAQAMPRMGSSSAFNYGDGFGVLRGVIAAFKIPITYASPAKWKRGLGLGRDKGASRTMATHLFPANAKDFSRVKDDGRAEAALIAYWSSQS